MRFATWKGTCASPRRSRAWSPSATCTRARSSVHRAGRGADAAAAPGRARAACVSSCRCPRPTRRADRPARRFRSRWPRIPGQTLLGQRRAHRAGRRRGHANDGGRAGRGQRATAGSHRARSARCAGRSGGRRPRCSSRAQRGDDDRPHVRHPHSRRQDRVGRREDRTHVGTAGRGVRRSAARRRSRRTRHRRAASRHRGAPARGKPAA